jgi:hypothetical protein
LTPSDISRNFSSHEAVMAAPIVALFFERSSSMVARQ